MSKKFGVLRENTGLGMGNDLLKGEFKMTITDDYLIINKYSRPGTKIRPTKIAVHYVGNAGSSAKANRNYFASGRVYASSHYIIGLNGEILRLIPENEMSYCTNQANSYTISIECCHPDNTGKFNSKTLNALTELCADICKRRGFDPLKDIIRHYDVTKKACPLWWAPNGVNKNAQGDFESFKRSVKKYMNGTVEAEEIKKEDDEVIVSGTMSVNGKDIKIDKIVKDNRSFVLVRNFENVGFEVGYNEATKNIEINNKPSNITVNDKDVKSINIKGSNYINVRDLAEVLGLDVEFTDGKISLK